MSETDVNVALMSDKTDSASSCDNTIRKTIAGTVTVLFICAFFLLNTGIPYLLVLAAREEVRYPIEQRFVTEGVCHIKSFGAIEQVPGLRDEKHRPIFEAPVRYDICIPDFCLRDQTWVVKVAATDHNKAFYLFERDYYAGKHSRCFTDGTKVSWDLSSWRQTSHVVLSVAQMVGAVFFVILADLVICLVAVPYTLVVFGKIDSRLVDHFPS